RELAVRVSVIGVLHLHPLPCSGWWVQDSKMHRSMPCGGKNASANKRDKILINHGLLSRFKK
ncbi:MAG: hypothetical protein J1F61_06720, partial [Clostridiales bacterium]|nr:hypothetical protein [Clostridiales bacterium]